LVGHVDPQRNLYTCDNQYLKFVGKDTFYGFLARHRPELFRGRMRDTSQFPRLKRVKGARLHNHIRRTCDIAGRSVAKLVQHEQKAGYYLVRRNGSDARGRSVPAGTYFYVLKANGKIAQKRMLLVKVASAKP
jgi:hypothetical protein